MCGNAQRRQFSLRFLCVVVIFFAILCAIGGRVYLKHKQQSRHDSAVREAVNDMPLRLTQIPYAFGKWLGEDISVQRSNLEPLTGAAIARRYEHQETGEFVDLVLVCGLNRQVCIHTIDLVFPLTEWQRIDATEFSQISDRNGNSLTGLSTSFKRVDLNGSSYVSCLSSYASISHSFDVSSVSWEASRSPKRHFGDAIGMCKIYFISRKREGQPATHEFARQAIARINAILLSFRSCES